MFRLISIPRFHLYCNDFCTHVVQFGSINTKIFRRYFTIAAHIRRSLCTALVFRVHTNSTHSDGVDSLFIRVGITNRRIEMPRWTCFRAIIMCCATGTCPHVFMCVPISPSTPICRTVRRNVAFSNRCIKSTDAQTLKFFICLCVFGTCVLNTFKFGRFDIINYISSNWKQYFEWPYTKCKQVKTRDNKQHSQLWIYDHMHGTKIPRIIRKMEETSVELGVGCTRCRKPIQQKARAQFSSQQFLWQHDIRNLLYCTYSLYF